MKRRGFFKAVAGLVAVPAVSKASPQAEPLATPLAHTAGYVQHQQYAGLMTAYSVPSYELTWVSDRSYDADEVAQLSDGKPITLNFHYIEE